MANVKAPTTTAEAPEPGTVFLAPSEPQAGPEAPATAPKARKTRTRGLPAAPAALAGANTVAVAGGYAASVAGPVVGAAVAGGLLAGAAALGLRQRRKVKRNNLRRIARDTARRNGLATNPATLRSGRWSPTTSGRGGSTPINRGGSTSSGRGGSTGSHHGGGGSGSTRPRSASTGSRSTPTRSGTGSTGTGRGRHRAGGGSGSSLRVGPPGNRRGRDRSGSGLAGSGGSARTRRQDRQKSGSTRTPFLMSRPDRPSRLRQMVGPRPQVGPRSNRGGLINRGDGSRRQPIQAMGRGAQRIRNGANRVGRTGRAIGRGAVRTYNSRAGRAARRWSVGAARRAWGILGPAVGATLAGANAAMRRRGWRGVWQAMSGTWGRLRAKWGPKNGKHAKAAAATAPAPPTIPAATVNKPANMVGGATPSATRGPVGLTGGPSMAQARIIEASREMVGAAMMYNPEGMMQIGNDMASFPEVIRNVANALKEMTGQVQNGETPMHPAIVDKLRALHAEMIKVAHEAEDLKPAFENLHNVDINRIRNPRPREEMWDYTNNREHVGH